MMLSADALNNFERVYASIFALNKGPMNEKLASSKRP
jgi:hypothetical protein